VLPDLDQSSHWLSHRPFLPRTHDDVQARCSHALVMWRFYLKAVIHDVTTPSTSAVASAVLAPLLVESLGSLATRYCRLVFSRARAFQFQTDVLCTVAVARSFSPWLTGRPQAAQLDDLCALLLRYMAVLTAPLPPLLAWVDEWLEDGDDGDDGDQQAFTNCLSAPPTVRAQQPQQQDETVEAALPPPQRSMALLPGATSGDTLSSDGSFDPVGVMSSLVSNRVNPAVG
jgi:hypothetical protein